MDGMNKEKIRLVKRERDKLFPFPFMTTEGK